MWPILIAGLAALVAKAAASGAKKPYPAANAPCAPEHTAAVGALVGEDVLTPEMTSFKVELFASKNPPGYIEVRQFAYRDGEKWPIVGQVECRRDPVTGVLERDVRLYHPAYQDDGYVEFQ